MRGNLISGRPNTSAAKRPASPIAVKERRSQCQTAEAENDPEHIHTFAKVKRTFTSKE